MTDDAQYDPAYRGSMTYYVGTPQVRYLLIDPAARAITEHTIHRRALADLPQIIGATDPAMVKLDEDNRLTIRALHSLLVQRRPPPDAPAFWYQADHHAPAVRYAGRAVVVAQSRDGERLVSARLQLEQMGWLFFWEEPPVDPHSLEVERLLAPLRAPVADMAASIAKMGRLPGVLDLESDARCLIAVIELIAARFETLLDESDAAGSNTLGLTDHDHALIPFFAWTHQVLTEQGYLDASMESPTLTFWISRYGY